MLALNGSLCAAITIILTSGNYLVADKKMYMECIYILDLYSLDVVEFN